MANGIGKPSGGSLFAAFGARFFDTLSKRVEGGRADAREERMIEEKRGYESGVRDEDYFRRKRELETGREHDVGMQERDQAFKKAMQFMSTKDKEDFFKKHVAPHEKSMAHIQASGRGGRDRTNEPIGEAEAARILGSSVGDIGLQNDADIWRDAIGKLAVTLPDDVVTRGKIMDYAMNNFQAKNLIAGNKAIGSAFQKAGLRHYDRVYDRDMIADMLIDSPYLDRLEEGDPMTLGELNELLMDMPEKEKMAILSELTRMATADMYPGLSERTGMDRNVQGALKESGKSAIQTYKDVGGVYKGWYKDIVDAFGSR